MENREVYSNKAEMYARYRWDYAPQAVEMIFFAAKLGKTSCVADIGAGTGILTRHFSGRVGHVFAVEPNAEMRRMAEVGLLACENCQVIDATAEATTLEPQSIDLVTVAQAIHWFNPEPTRAEFRRILKPGGWLAVLRNYGTDEALNRASAELYSPELGFETQQSPRGREWKPLIYYYGNGRFQCIRFPFSFYQDWEGFFGALLSAAGMPDEMHPRFSLLEKATRRVFDRFSQDGKLEVRGETELYIGQVSGTA